MHAIAGVMLTTAGIVLVPGGAHGVATAAVDRAARLAPIRAAPGFAAILYDTDLAATSLTTGISPTGDVIGPGLTPARGARRQEPSGTHVLGAGADDAPYRVAKINGRQLFGLGAASMVALLEGAVDGHCEVAEAGAPPSGAACVSHLVAIDEISPAFANPSAGGTGQTGLHFSEAMSILRRTPSAWGGSYASRIAAYVDASVTVALARKGLWRSGHIARMVAASGAYRRVMPGLAAAGSLWLEMYKGVRGPRGMVPLAMREWTTVPAAFGDYLSAFHGSVSRVHFLFSNGGPSSARCPDPQACQWAAAAQPGINRRILANGPGEYRLGAQIAPWLMQFNRYFPDPAASPPRVPGRPVPS